MKKELREHYKSLRKQMRKSEVTTKSSMAQKNFLNSSLYKNAVEIMVYMPLGNETETSEIISEAFADGKMVVVPVTDADGNITPCYITEKTRFEKGVFSVNEPCEKEIADITSTDVVIVPGIAFDKKGTRLGFGKGCYDRFLNGITAIKIGFCYELQLCDDIPAQPHDEKMDYIITEKEIIKCKIT